MDGDAMEEEVDGEEEEAISDRVEATARLSKISNEYISCIQAYRHPKIEIIAVV
jgi:hypothetical protein